MTFLAKSNSPSRSTSSQAETFSSDRRCEETSACHASGTTERGKTEEVVGVMKVNR
jgi:hypothetical protein